MTDCKTGACGIEDEDDFEFVALDTSDYDSNLAELAFKVVEWWTEDYSYDELLEEFDVLPEESFYDLMKSGRIDEERVREFFTASE